MKPTLMSTAVLVGLGVNAAFANDQLAGSIGVEPDIYTTAELIQIRDAMENGKTWRVDAIEAEARAPEVTRRSEAAATSRQLERTLGVEPGSLAPADLVRLKSAVADNDRQTVDFILDGGGNPDSNGPGKRSLARAMGVDPDDYTRAELSAMYIDAYEG